MKADAGKPKGRRVRGVAVHVGPRDVIKSGATQYDLRDPYYTALSLRWPAFLLAILIGYLAINAVFAVLYMLDPDSVANLPAGSFWRAFFFSVETFATVGYGVMSPQSTYGHVIATSEIFTGLLCTAVITGLLFVRLSRPRGKIRIASQAVICPFEGIPTLMVRVANGGASVIFGAEARLSLLIQERGPEGETNYFNRPLRLLRDHDQAFTLTWTLRHPIDAASPLFGLDLNALEAVTGHVQLTISGTDAMLSAPVHAMRIFSMTDLLVGYRYADLVSPLYGGSGTHLDLGRLSEVVEMPA